MRESANVEGLVQDVMNEFGRIDIWVSNAGGLQEQRVNYLVKTPEESWDQTTTLNLKAPWMCAKAAWPALRINGGTIINVSSVGGISRGSPTNGVYSAAKAGLNHLTKTLALEMAPFNIRVNAILPGSVRTEDYEDASGGGDEYFEKMAEAEPLKRLGKEEDFGAAAVYLASEASSWVTGHLLMVSGRP